MSRAALVDVRDTLEALLARVETALAADAANDTVEPVRPSSGPNLGLAWGAKVSSVFRARIRWLAEDLDIGPAPGLSEPSWVMTWIAWESGRSFRADVKNMAGSGATGLIQFMPATARSLGTTVEALASMTPEDQLNFVWKYLEPFKGRLRSLADGYMAILWPAAVGKPDDYALFTGGAAYRQNAGLDTNKDGRVTKREAAAKVSALLDEGLRPGNVA